jgi:hypothetical protein
VARIRRIARITPKETPTPIPIFAPVERPELDADESAGFVDLRPVEVVWETVDLKSAACQRIDTGYAFVY